MSRTTLARVLILIAAATLLPSCHRKKSSTPGASSPNLDVDGDGVRRFPWGPDFDDDNDAARQVIIGHRDADDTDNAVQDTLGVGTLTAGTPVAVGQGPRGIETADFDNDGDLDLVTANQNDDSLSILLGDGSGGFGPAASIALSGSGFVVGCADFDGDGNIDLVAGLSGGLSVLLGNGDGTFGAELPNADVANSIVWLAIAEFNGDAALDVAVVDTNGFSGSMRVLLGDGDGTFTQSDNEPVASSNLQGIAIGDLDGDTDLDAVGIGSIAVNSGEYVVFLGANDGTFTAQSPVALAFYATWGYLALLDNNGSPDLVVTSAINNGALVALGVGDGTFGGTTAVGGINAINDVRAADMDGDGNLDLVAASQGSGVGIAIGSAAGTFAAFTTQDAGANEFDLAIGDFDGNLKWDVAVANISGNNVGILLGD